jgi:hypothetical protein
MNSHFLDIYWKSPLGKRGTDKSLWNPFNRAVDRLFDNGNPIKGLCKCFFKNEGIARWLGVFVHSDGERVIFFPGNASQQSYIAGALNPQTKVHQPFNVDHISLEKDRRSWHFTAPKSSDHIGKTSTLELGQSRVFWFGLSVAKDELLMPLYQKTRFRFPVPGSDAQRRINSFVAAREGVEFPLITLNSEVERVAEPSLLHFAVIVGPSGFEHYTGPYQCPPPSGDLIVRPQTQGQPVPVRSYRFSLSDEVDIQIDASEVAGNLKMPFVYSTPAPSQPKSTLLVASIKKGLAPDTK